MKIWIFEFVSYYKIQTKLKTRFKRKHSKQNLSNKIEHKIHTKLKIKFKPNGKQNLNDIQTVDGCELWARSGISGFGPLK
jgi:hypothetical protein